MLKVRLATTLPWTRVIPLRIDVTTTIPQTAKSIVQKACAHASPLRVILVRSYFSCARRILMLIGDISAVRTEAFAESKQFRDESTSTVSRLVTYSNARAAYDAEYVANKSSNVRRALESTIDSLVTPFVAYVTF